MARNIKFAPGEFYHLYNRGTEKRKIFLRREDYERFLSLLYLCNSSEPVRIDNLQRVVFEQGSTLLRSLPTVERGERLVDIGAYCLMPNHFHIILRSVTDEGISRFMQKLITGYSMYFNKRYERTGALFQGRFKALHASNDVYLRYLISYIHLNPVKLIDPTWRKNGIKNQKQAKIYLEKYKYSSYLDYVGQDRIEKMIIEKKTLPEYFDSPKGFKESVTEWLNYKNFNDVAQPLSKVEPFEK